MPLKASRRGVAQALVEFALVLPLVIVLTLGVVQLVLYAHARDVVITSAQEGARLAAEDGRTLAEGQTRAQALVAAGLGSSAGPVTVAGSIDADTVHLRLAAALHPVLPLPLVSALPISAEAWVARERFRPGGGD
jgi:Flp pilus assembly protein TadG